MDCWVFLQELKVSPSILMEDRQKACSGSDSSELSMDPELWLIAEQSTKEILSAVQPNVASEWRRRELIDYIQRVIKGCFGTEVRHPPVPSFPLVNEIASVLDLITRVFLVTSLGCLVKFRSGRMS